MPAVHDGPQSRLFAPAPFRGNSTLKGLAEAPVSDQMREHAKDAPSGSCAAWGIPFEVKRVVLLQDKPVSVAIGPVRARWLVFMHTADIEPLEWNEQGLLSPTRGAGRLAEHVADYVLCYADGSEARAEILRRHHLGMVQRGWGECCFQAVAHRKPHPLRPLTEQPEPGSPWGATQTRTEAADYGPWVNWLWAWENPKPTKAIVGIRFEPKAGSLVVSAISSGGTDSWSPLRWDTRRKAVLRLPKGVAFDPRLDRHGLLEQVQLDLGQVISAQPRTVYPNDSWADTYACKPPDMSPNEVLVEYTAHPDARFHLPGGKTVPVAALERGRKTGPLTPVARATQRLRLRVVEKANGRLVPARLHVHGEAGEYLAPVDRHRIPNSAWFEDYAPEFVNQGTHFTTYIPGEAVMDLPVGRVYIEVSKGFEIAPVRTVVEVSPDTTVVTIPIANVLPWRERGWVTADTHVHFLSPHTARLEGAAEGVNVVNLLASQWGELMTNAGDFDGKTTFGAKESGGDGEYLVRVGTENRQHVLGHISLLGYAGPIIAPMTTGGPDESALGDAVAILLGEWARQCREQGGLVVLPHFPNPRAEHAAAIVQGQIDAIEMTSWGNLYGGLDPYSLSDWYRYLNCGCFLPAVAGTDKMSANTAVGTVRTYARIPDGRPFTYDAWMEAVRSGHTFVTYGPLLEFAVEGKPAGSRIRITRRGGTLEVEWEAASVTLPLSRVEIVVNGEIRESRSVAPHQDNGFASVKVERSSWIALLVRGHYPGRPEIVAAHSSPVIVEVEGSRFMAAADAVTILDQIEGAIAYLDTIGTRAETQTYRRMRLLLMSAHRTLHNELHQLGHYHRHLAGIDFEQMGTVTSFCPVVEP